LDEESLQNNPSAILCDSDVLAVGVYKAARALHLSIPNDIAVIGFDDSSVARMLVPELTSVAVPPVSIGEQAFSLLFSVLEGAPVPSQATISLELVVRASTVSPGKENTWCDIS
jgi:LacI family repressor for deo operon, udp, cdd, tsx, nupC, and nupG